MKVRVQAKDDTQSVIAEGHTRQNEVRMFENNWYFEPEAVDMTHLVISDRTYNCPYKGIANWLDYVSPELTAKNVGWIYQEPLPTYNFTKGQIGFYARATAGTTTTQLDDDA